MSPRIFPFVFLALTHLCFSQVAIPVVLPEAPSVVAAIVRTPTVSAPKSKVHAFFDAKNIALFSMGAAFVASDSITTQRMVGTGKFDEQDPIAKPFVNNGWKGQALISAIGFGGSVGLSYVFHKFGHHKMERYVGLSLIGIELAATVHNSRLEAETQESSSEPDRGMKGGNQPRMRDSTFASAFGKPYTLVGNSGTERNKFLASH